MAKDPMLTKDDLVSFETEIAELFAAGRIRARPSSDLNGH